MDIYALTSALLQPLLQLINTLHMKYHGSSLTTPHVHNPMGSGIVFVSFLYRLFAKFTGVYILAKL